jgi:hypothetical protein
MLGLIGQLLDRMIAGKRPVAEKPPSKGLADVTLNQLWKHRETERQQW